MKKVAFALIFLLAGVGVLTVLALGRVIFRPQPADANRQLFQGVSYHREARQSPRPLVIHVVKVDLRQPGVSFLVTPVDLKGQTPLRARTTSRFLDEFNLQVAINGSGFTPWRSNTLLDYYPHSGDPVGPTGLAASKGSIYSPAVEGAPVLYISRTNQARFNTPTGRVYNALSGNVMLLEQGIIQPERGGDLQPRTAVGLDKSGRTLILVVVDGRQPGYSEGVTLAELAQILLDNGSYTAMALDGGGSSTLVSQANNGRAKVLNSPIDQRIPGRERPVGNHLGIYAENISKP